MPAPLRDPGESWQGDGPEREPVAIGPLGWLRVAARGTVLLGLLVVAFPLLLLLRLPEAAIWGEGRPVTPWITRFVCRFGLAIMGFSVRALGAPMTSPGIMVANHASWLDIFALNAFAQVYFVAKSEVRGWAGIGWLARGTGTHFVERRRTAAKRQEGELSARLRAGHRLMIFPEGTSTDGLRVLPFRTTIFAPLFAPDVPEGLNVQPVSLRYTAPVNREDRFYGWWGQMGFVPSLLEVLAQTPQGGVSVIWGEPIPVAGHTRKTLAKAAEDAVRNGFEVA